MDRRRNVVIALGVAASIPRTIFAQMKKTPIVIGWLGANSSDLGQRNMAPFKEGLAALGWKEGAQFVIEGRDTGTRPHAVQLAHRRARDHRQIGTR